MADNNNRYNRRFKLRSSMKDRAAEVHGFRIGESVSVDENLFAERAWAQPNYQYSRHQPENTTPSVPTLSPPSVGDIWDLNGFSSLAGYVVLVGVAHVNLELWVLDQENGNWYKVGSASTLATGDGFDFPDLVRNHKCFVYCATATGAGKTVTIYATGL